MSYPAIGLEPGVEAVQVRVTEWDVTGPAVTLVGAAGGAGDVFGVLPPTEGVARGAADTGPAAAPALAIHPTPTAAVAMTIVRPSRGPTRRSAAAASRTDMHWKVA